jgi:predicted O-methyltransferase YrrM
MKSIINGRVSSKRRIFFLIIIGVVVAGVLFYLFIRDKEDKDLFIKVSGNIEATEADVGFKVAGRIVSRLFEEGDWVEKGKILAEVVREAKPKRILEVGTLIGYFAILMAKELEADAHLTTIEIHADEARSARQNIKKAQVLPTIDAIVGNAIKVLPKLSEKFDVVFIDAEKTQYREYLRLIENRLHKGSTIVVDNAGIFADEMKDYLDHVKSSGNYRSEYVPVGEDGLEVSEIGRAHV